MERNDERRKSMRLHFRWPVWFAENFNETLLQGQMQDVSSSGMAFTCNTNEGHIYIGQNITIRFSVPRFGADDSFGVADFIRSGHICKVDHVNNNLRRIALQFSEQLPFDPAEEAGKEAAAQVKTATV